MLALTTTPSVTLGKLLNLSTCFPNCEMGNTALQGCCRVNYSISVIRNVLLLWATGGPACALECQAALCVYLCLMQLILNVKILVEKPQTTVFF